MFSHTDAEEPQRYLEGQRQAYATYAVEAAAHAHWLGASPRSVSLVAAYDGAGDMVGGARVHLRMPRERLSIELYLRDPTLNAMAEREEELPPAESAGVWIRPSFARSGLADFIFLGAMAACRLMGAGWACGCAHGKSVPLYRKYGSSYDPGRPYPYPDARYTSYALYVDLGWPDAPGHPARQSYREMRMALGRDHAFRFEPSVAQEWAPPLASAVPWADADSRIQSSGIQRDTLRTPPEAPLAGCRACVVETDPLTVGRGDTHGR